MTIPFFGAPFARNASLASLATLHFLLLLLCVTTCNAATSCIQNKNTGAYEAANKIDDKPCPSTADFPPGEPSTAILPEPIPAQEVALVSTATNESENSSTESVWHLKAEDGSVYVALKRWASMAGWQMSWEIPVDFPIEILDSSTGTFETSVRRVLTAFRVSDYPPYPCFHENRVVRVVRRIQGNDDECRQ